MFLIIDADGLAFRGFYALESKVDYPMTEGALRIFNKILKDFQPDDVAIVFDSTDKEKQKIYSQYRKNREEPWDLGLADYKKMLKVFIDTGYPVYRKSGYEADRVIATLVHQNRKRDKIIYSDDKDFFQLLDNKVVMYSVIRKGYIDSDFVEHEFDLADNRLFREFLIYTGDAVDRIPRIFRTKIAYQLIKKKGFLENWFWDKDFSALSNDMISLIEKHYANIKRNFLLVNLLDEDLSLKKLSFDDIE